MMEEIIDVDNYKFRLQCILPENIDIVLKRNGLFRLNAFSYTVGDCLFDSFEMLLHFRYTSNELRNGLIDHFRFCLKNNDVEAIQSYQYELAPDFLYELHGVNDIGTYLHKMRYSASTNIKESDRGLWGDTFCIRWLAKWLDISIAVWSLTRKTRYLLFNQHENAIPYCVLFHAANPVSGHYEPLVYQKFPICICNQSNIYLSPICKDIESHWMHIANNMLLNGLTIAKQVTSNCGDSLFNAICYLVATIQCRVFATLHCAIFLKCTYA